MPLKVLVYVLLPGHAARYGAALAGRSDIEVTAVDTMAAALKAIPEADVLVAFGANLRPPFFTEARRLKWVHALGTGVDGITDDPSLPADVLVTATRGIHGVTMSEMAIMLMLALARDLPRSLRAQERRAWERWSGALLHGRTVGILGVGRIAEDLAPRCRALGMRVIGISRTVRPVPGFDHIYDHGALEQAAAESDHLVMLVPLSEETRNLVGARVFAAMKPTAFLVNLARGGIVDEDALVAALNERRIAGAALDTFLQEPLPADHPLWRAPNTIITAHLGGTYDRYVEDAVRQFATNLDHFIAGRLELMANRETRA